MNIIPLTLEFRLQDRRTLLVVASRGSVTTTDHYRIGHSADRQQVAERLLAETRLHNGQPPTLQCMVDRLTQAEVEAVRKLDEMDVECTLEPAHDPANPEASKVSLATQLVDLAIRAGIELWQEPDGKSWATIPRGDCWENVPIASGVFRQWVFRTYFRTEAKVPAACAVQDAINTLSGIAENEGKVHRTHLRVGASDDNLYLDLADPDWNVLEITPNACTIIQRPPVKFRRVRAMKAHAHSPGRWVTARTSEILKRRQ